MVKIASLLLHLIYGRQQPFLLFHRQLKTNCLHGYALQVQTVTVNTEFCCLGHIFMRSGTNWQVK
jgi:hypothetical protein